MFQAFVRGLIGSHKAVMSKARPGKRVNLVTHAEDSLRPSQRFEPTHALLMPSARHGGSVALFACGDVPTKSRHPFAQGLPADDDTSYAEEIPGLRRARRCLVVGADGARDDIARETIAFATRHLSWDLQGGRIA